MHKTLLSRVQTLPYRSVLVALILWLHVWTLFNTPRSNLIAADFFPIFFGSGLVTQHQSPYGPEATQALVEHWIPSNAAYRTAGNGYPLPLLLLATPLSFLPYTIAAMLWFGICCLGILISGRLPGVHPLVLLLSWPMFWALWLGQATAVWLGLTFLLLVGMRERRAWVVGLCIALLPLKPQVGLLYAIAGCVWAWREQRRALWWALASGVALFGASLLLQPDWISRWVEQLRVYNGVVSLRHEFIWAVPLLAACWKLPWWGKLAIVQTFMFPLVALPVSVSPIHPYALAPLMIVWCAVGGRTAYVGVLTSLLWLVVFNSSLCQFTTELTIFLPLVAAGVWRILRPSVPSLHAGAPLIIGEANSL